MSAMRRRPAAVSPRDSSVPIVIRKGNPGGAAIFKKLGPNLDQGIRIMDVSMTWQDAFRTHYSGLEVDPARFSIQRNYRSPRILGHTSPKHDLTEKISVLMREFRSNKRIFMVNLVRRQRKVTYPRSLEMGQRQNPRPNPTPTTPTSSGSNQPGTGVPLIGSSRIAAGSNNGIREVNKRPVAHTPNYVDFNQSSSSSTEQELRFPEANFAQNTAQTSSSSAGFMPMSMDLNDEEGDNFDARSDVTNFSQDSQIDDLLELGITYEDVKTPFCKRAKRNISNTQFLKAKHEMEELKLKNPKRWTKWTSYIPATANIIRDLLDV